MSRSVTERQQRRLVGYLEWFRSEETTRLPWYETWRKYADQLGIDFEWVSTGPGEVSTVPGENAAALFEKCSSLIRRADALLLPFPSFFSRSDCFYSQIRERVREGSRLLVTGISRDNPSIEQLNALLAPYDMLCTGKRMFVPGVGPKGRIEIPRDPHCFRHPELFAGVERVIVQDATAIHCCGESCPVLVAPIALGLYTEDFDALGHRETSYGPWRTTVDDQIANLACIAAWYGLNGEAAMVIRGDIFDDPPAHLQGTIPYPSILENKQFAMNVLRFLAASTPHRAGLGCTPYELFDSIERNLVDFVIAVLKSVFGNDNWWFEGVPTPIRKDCATRQQEEKSTFSIEVFMHFINLKTIIDHNWKHFDHHFSRLGGGRRKKNDYLADFDRLNETRRFVMHSIKAHRSGWKAKPEDVDFLKQQALQAAELLDRREETA